MDYCNQFQSSMIAADFKNNLINWLIDWLIDCWLIVLFINWVADLFSYCMINFLIILFIDWLIDCCIQVQVLVVWWLSGLLGVVVSWYSGILNPSPMKKLRPGWDKRMLMFTLILVMWLIVTASTTLLRRCCTLNKLIYTSNLCVLLRCYSVCFMASHIFLLHLYIIHFF